MVKRVSILAIAMLIAIVSMTSVNTPAAQAAGRGQPSDWKRFYYYPYVYYPHSFRQVPQSYDHMYHRYPVERRIPVYNANWHNFYPSKQPYYDGHHFILDVF